MNHKPSTGSPATELLTATLVGGPTLLVRYAGRVFLTDPTFDQPRDYPSSGVTLRKLTGPALAADRLGPVDVVLLSHDQHPDNLDTAGRGVLADVPVVLSTPLAGTRLPGVTGLEPWQDVTLRAHGRPDVCVTAVPARHGPAGSESITGPVTGFVLRADGHPTVYVSGDNASLDVVGAIAERARDIAVAILFVGAANVGRFGPEPMTLDAERALAAADLLHDAIVVPVHAEGWAHFTQSADDVVRAFAGTTSAGRLVVPPRGERVVLR
jgi:L-ascorbate metabolism protein UlaG (beta-lactamase superfamily)